MQKKPFSVNESGEYYIPGNIFVACEIAFNDYYFNTRSIGQNLSDFEKLLNKKENYSITVTEHDDNYIVYIKPDIGKPLPGGDGTYTINKYDFTIVERILTK